MVSSDVKNRAIQLYKSRIEASKSFLAFIQHLHPNYELKQFHRIIIEQCEKWMLNPNSKLIISMPPRHGKSEIVSRYLPAYIFGKYRGDEVMFVSYGADLAAGMSRDVQQIIDSPEYKQIFPLTKLGHGFKKTEKEFDIVSSDESGKGGKYHCAGFDGVMTGKGFTFGLIDDAHKGSEDANSTKDQETLWSKYQGAFLTRRSGKARVLVMGTRWHPRDLIGRILEGPDKDEWTVVTFPFECEDENAPFEYRKKGEFLWPERFNAKTIEGFDPYLIAALYQQSPRIRKGSVIKEEWFVRTHVLPQFITLVLYWDVGGSDNPTADSTVGTLMGKTVDGKGIVIYQEGFQFSPKNRNVRMLSLSKEMCEMFNGVSVYVEAGIGLGVQTVNEIRDEMLNAQIPIKIDKVRTSKFDRASGQKDSFLAAAEGFRISFYEGMNKTDWIKKFFDECSLLRYEGNMFVGPHDDRLDSMVGAWNRGSKEPFNIQFLEDVVAQNAKEQPKKKWNPFTDPTFH